MTVASDVSLVFSHFYLDGEAAFMDGDALERNPYAAGDRAADAWRAGWLAASHTASISGSLEPFQARDADRH
ncbi:MAG: hypothetical protein HIU92_13975 [Proteobacteria bacterium]|nr:hypothetical protein [Pseudomonadota bacterium]